MDSVAFRKYKNQVESPSVFNEEYIVPPKWRGIVDIVAATATKKENQPY